MNEKSPGQRVGAMLSLITFAETTPPGFARSPRRCRRGFLLATVFATILQGCAYPVVVRDARLAEPPAVDRIDATIVIRYPAGFEEQIDEVAIPHDPTTSWAIHTGRPTIALFDQVVAAMFTEVRRTIGDGTLDAAGARDAIGVLEFESASARISTVPIEALFDVPEHIGFVRYRISLRSADGTRVASWHVSGVVSERCRTCIEELTKAAMQSAMAEFIVEFYEDPAVAEWLRRGGIGH